MITLEQLRSELDELLERAHIDPKSVGLKLSRALDRKHVRSPRSHALLNVDTRQIEVARAILALDAPHRLGILAHEVGHLRCPARELTEDDIDRCAQNATNVLISYDRSWPGHHPRDSTLKGLQVGTDMTAAHATKLRKSSALLDAEIAAALARRPRRKHKGIKR